MLHALRGTAALAALALVTTGCLGQSGDSDPERGKDVKEFTLTIAANAVAGGKNAAEADWITKWVIPRFVEQQREKGRKATVKFEASGVDDEEYKTKISLALKTGSGPDIVGVDGIWVGEFAEAGYIKPLTETVGDQADDWDGWEQIPDAVQELMSFEDKRYGIPAGTDGRVLFYNKALFAKAGLPADWQPKSWDEILQAGQALKKLPGVTPLQINAGTAMGEATTMQGVLPLLAGTGTEVFADGKWQGDTAAVRDVLGFYQKVYGGKLGDPTLQQEAQGRDKSFLQFSQGKVGILLEGDYFWRGVLEPKLGVAKMANRDKDVGYALIPAKTAGAGLRGQDFVSMSGGGGRAINPATKFPQQAWELLTFMNSPEAIKASMGTEIRITARNDVNDEVLKDDPLLVFIAEKVLPLTAFRPGLAVYPQVSLALQQATLDVVAGKSPQDASKSYAQAVEKAVGGADNVTNG